MKKKRFKKWLKAIDVLVKEYKAGTHSTSDCSICAVVAGDCNKCILNTGALTCVSMPTFQEANHNNNSEPRLVFYKRFKQRLLNYRIIQFESELSLKDIQFIAWDVELDLLTDKNKLS